MPGLRLPGASAGLEATLTVPEDFVAAGAAFAGGRVLARRLRGRRRGFGRFRSRSRLGRARCAADLVDVAAALAGARDLPGAGALADAGALAGDWPVPWTCPRRTLAGTGALPDALPVAFAGAFFAGAAALAFGCAFVAVEALALSGADLEGLRTGAVAFVATAGTALFAGTALVAPRGGASVAAAAFFDDSFEVLATAAFADAFEAFAFTTAPFLVSAASVFVGTIGLSCHGEGDRR